MPSKKPERSILPGFFVAESDQRRQVIVQHRDTERRPVASKSAKNPEPFTIVVAASELPKRILDRFPEPPSADARFAVTVEPEESDTEKLAGLRQKLEAGLDDLAAGRVSQGSEVFARLKKRFPAG
jgi:hypothetical protein